MRITPLMPPKSIKEIDSCFDNIPFLKPREKMGRCFKCDKIKKGRLEINGKFICYDCEESLNYNPFI